MNESSSPEDVHRILMQALVSYSDACTLPNLTPTCPFYIQTDEGATCGEECRALIDQYGIADRPVREVTIGGLVMKGRALPPEVATGMSLFDAQQTYIQHRQLPPGQQSTSSLLLGLEAAICSFPLDSGGERAEKAKAIWAELDHRGVPVDRITREAILPDLAFRIGAMSGTAAFSDINAWPASVSDDFVERLHELASKGWTAVLEAAIEAEASPETAIRRARSSMSGRTARAANRLARRLEATDLGFASEPSDMPQDLRIPYSASPYFSERIHEWLCRLVTEDFDGLLEWRPPPPSVFLALPRVPSRTDEVARWIWDRFVETRLEDWDAKSLLHEWRSHREGPKDLPPRVWHERTTDADRVAALALEKSTQSSKVVARSRGLEPGEFVASAVHELKNGRLDRAANIFSGLAELRPTDGDVLNNLGFCLLPTDPRRALSVLQEASLYPREQFTLSTANRVLALHLVDRDEDAIRLASETLGKVSSSEGSCYVWEHDHAGGGLTLAKVDDPVTYLTDLAAHIRDRSSKASSGQ